MKNYKVYLPYMAGILVSLIFGLSFLFTKEALESMAPMLLLSYRFAAAALVLTVLALFRVIKLDYSNKPVKQLLILSFIQPIAYFIFETLGVMYTSSSEAGLMIALIPVVVTVLAAVFLKEKTTALQLGFVITSVSGVAFIVLMSGGLSIGGHMAGTAALVGAVLSGGAFSVLSRKLSKNFTPIEITFVMMWTGALVFNGVSVITGIMNNNLSQYAVSLFSVKAVAPILYLGVLSSVGAFFMLNYTLSKLPASVSSVFSNLTTVVSVVAGVFVRNEAFHWYQFVGGIFIILGVWGTNRFRKQQDSLISSAEIISE